MTLLVETREIISYFCSVYSAFLTCYLISVKTSILDDIQKYATFLWLYPDFDQKEKEWKYTNDVHILQTFIAMLFIKAFYKNV